MKELPNYYSIITASVRYDNRLSDSEKLLFAEITSLTNTKGYCYASNNYFSNLYDVSKNTISRRINRLASLGYLKIEMVYEGKEITQRKIYPINTNSDTPIIRNGEDIITSNINTSNKYINEITEVISYLNERTGSKYKETTKGNQEFIIARLNEGFSVDELKIAIDNKVDDWLGTKDAKYLRPSTLFRKSNFEGYLNQNKMIKSKKEQTNISEIKEFEL
ncbi:alpha/beta hydrolase [Macrococcoides bohemicum]|uniref:conserved phage C-terminal domain-containing protein n=1 Tax=Macrococcoides bohemicum TaxID=1903056 RepID=UPI0010594652|nr:conserved phage C-terminal domain-containing protein [Macrococcus bohemicus]TDL39423.1 alpha/beta hydrolase [Macrococcus bohemicus]